MVGRDTDGTQPDLRIGIAAELAAAGLADAREIGRGGFGVVYRCVEHSLDRLVAVKVLDTRSNDDERARFLREQRALGRFASTIRTSCRCSPPMPRSPDGRIW